MIAPREFLNDIFGNIFTGRGSWMEKSVLDQVLRQAQAMKRPPVKKFYEPVEYDFFANFDDWQNKAIDDHKEQVVRARELAKAFYLHLSPLIRETLISGSWGIDYIGGLYHSCQYVTWVKRQAIGAPTRAYMVVINISTKTCKTFVTDAHGNYSFHDTAICPDFLSVEEWDEYIKTFI